jgi:hypothetical protein
VPDLTSHQVDPADEGRHPPGDEPYWNESVYLDFVADEGAVAGYVRIGLYPNLGVTWWTTVVVGRDRSLIASTAYDLPVAGGTGLVLASGGVDVSAEVLDPLTSVRVHGSAVAAAHADPADIYRHRAGEPTRLELDLTWATDGTPYQYDVTTRYEIPCLVTGSVTVGDERIEIDGQGQRDHSWGERDWWAFGWCWSAARLDDGTRVHLTEVRIPDLRLGMGYLQAGGKVTPLEGGSAEEVLGEHGFPVAATTELQPGDLELAIDPIAFGPVLLEAPDGRTSRFPRAVAHFTAADGRTGTGWIEWNQPQPVVAPE